MSQGRDFSEIVARAAGTYGLEAIANILTMMNKRTQPFDTEDELVRHVIFADEFDIHDVAITFGESDIEAEENMLHFDQIKYRKIIPESVFVYDLVHDNSNAGGLIFQPPGNTLTFPSSIGTRGHGGATSDESSDIQIENDTKLELGDNISIAINMYLPASTKETIVLQKFNNYNVRILPSNKIQWQVWPNGVDNKIEATYTPGWRQVVLTYTKTGNIQIHIDNSQVATSAVTSTPAGPGQQLTTLNRVANNSDNRVTNNNDNRITGTLPNPGDNLYIFSGGELNLESGFALSWLSILRNDVSLLTNWINDYSVRRTLRTVDADEITTIPFINGVRPNPNASVGEFFAP